MSKIKVGYTSRLYPEQRNIIGLVPEADYYFLRDFYSVLGRLRSSFGVSFLFPQKENNAEFKFQDFDLNKVDLLHFFNMVSFGKRPWISTFETIIPRFGVALKCRELDPERIRRDSGVLYAMEALAGASCKKIVALSHCTAHMQLDFLSLFPEFSEEIISKQVVLPPPQNISHSREEKLVRKIQQKEPIRFMFVGHQFFGKGGREILHVFNEARKNKQWPIELVIISKLVPDGYATCTGIEDTAEMKKYITAHSDWINYFPSMPHRQVIKMMESCDVGLLPSYAETYGYSVLEFQSRGCPVITTNIRSFPEINNTDIGWVIPVPKKTNGEAKYRDPEDRTLISLAISKGLNSVISEIFEKPYLIAEKGRRAIERIKSEHSSEGYAKSLLSIYQAAVEGK